MFCGECGTKNKKNDAFCSECGAPLEHEKEQKNTSSIVKKSIQPLSKKNKIIISIIVAIIAVLGIGYKIVSDITNPKTIAKQYIQANIKQDGDKLYKYLELEGDKTFVSKKTFIELLKKNNTKISNIDNYKITGIEYGEGKLTAKVKFTYTTKESTSEKTNSINLMKQKNKKYLIFDNWKIADMIKSSAVINDYKIKVAKGSTVTYEGIKLTDKYLDKEESNSKLDVYKLPQVFTTEATVKTILSNGIEIEETVKPTSYYNTHTVTFNERSLTDAAKEKLTAKIKESLTIIYTNAIAKTVFSDIRTNFEHGNIELNNLEKNYTQLLTDLESANNTLTSIEFTDITISDLELDSNSYLKMSVKAKFNYIVSYTNWNNETETHEDSDYDYMTLILAYEKGTYYLVDASGLKYSFSRY